MYTTNADNENNANSNIKNNTNNNIIHEYDTIDRKRMCLLLFIM